jgi:hypothetical protein
MNRLGMIWLEDMLSQNLPYGASEAGGSLLRTWLAT